MASLLSGKIVTPGKVANSATTATSANTASAIVARDASGNFSAGAVTVSSIIGGTTATAFATTENLSIGRTSGYDSRGYITNNVMSGGNQIDTYITDNYSVRQVRASDEEDVLLEVNIADGSRYATGSGIARTNVNIATGASEGAGGSTIKIGSFNGNSTTDIRGTVTLPSTTSIGNVDSTELSYLNGVTSSIQAQLDSKTSNVNPVYASPEFTGTVTLPSTTSIGNVDSTEISYLNGVTSSIQTQLNAKAPTANPTFTGTVTLPAGTIVNADIKSDAAIDWTKLAISSTVSSTEIGYVDGVTSAIQTQLNSKVSNVDPTFTANGLTISATELGYLDGLESNIQAQLNSKVSSVSPTFTGTVGLGTSAVFSVEGSSNDDNETTLTVANPTADRTITLPDADGIVALTTSPAFIGTPTAPTASAGTNTTQIATTAFVQSNSERLVAKLLSATAAIGNTEAVILSFTAPQDSIAVGDTFRFTGFATRAGTGNVAPTFRIRIGTATLTGAEVSVLTPPATATVAPFKFEAIVTCRSIVGSSAQIGGAASALYSTGSGGNSITAPVTVNTGVDNLIEATIDSNSVSGNTYKFEHAILEKLPA